MALRDEFEENVVELAFYGPVVTIEPNGEKRIGYPETPTFTTLGIFVMAEGDITYGPNGAQVRTTNDVFIDKEPNSNAMYRAIMDREEKWQMVYDGRRFLVTSIEAAGEADDPYILRVEQIKKPAA
ncbi:MAG: hypothetical protein N2Z74_10560 [Syntrophales bacterium]|nr:hypothetical protein [Syntrophales bacterium]